MPILREVKEDMASKERINSMTELFVGKPHKYEWVRVDKSFHDIFKKHIIESQRVRKEVEKREGIKCYPTWKDLTKELAEKQMRNRII